MRAYYGAIEGGTNLTAYRHRMLSLFQTLEPTLTITAQRHSDQMRAIQRLHLLDEPTLERLLREMQPIDSTRQTTPVELLDSHSAAMRLSLRYRMFIRQYHRMSYCQVLIR